MTAYAPLSETIAYALSETIASALSETIAYALSETIAYALSEVVPTTNMYYPHSDTYPLCH